MAHLQKHDKNLHFDIVKVNNGADEYCNKEDTRLDGPWSFGVRPARYNKKGDKARQNRELVEMGPEKAVELGYVRIEKYLELKRNIDAYKLATLKPTTSATTRGVWVWGESGSGKSSYVRDTYGEYYDKSQSKWWDGYTGQKTVLLDDHDNPCLGHYLKRWADHYPCTGETKGACVPLVHERFVVTSNHSIEDLYRNEGE